MEQLVDADHVTEDPGYVSCMFCTARCFKLHGGHGAVEGTSKAACAASGSSSVHERPQAGVEGIRSTDRKHRAPFFVKTVKITTLRRKNCELHLPAFFFKNYGDRFQKFVLLQGPSSQVWPVNLCVSCGSTTGRPTVRFSRGWKDFAADHDLQLGDKLIFTLVSFSRFSVQVFDPSGKKKRTSSEAVSGWRFRREDFVDGGSVLRQKKSIFVNWKNKVVRESSLGSGGIERSKKGKAAGNGQTSKIYGHLKRENKKLEKRNALVAKFRARKPGKYLPLSLLGQKWSKQSGSASSSDSEEEFVHFDAEQGDAANLLEWEPLENSFPLQTWPLALNSNDPSKDALVTTQQHKSVGESSTQPENFSIASFRGLPPSNNPHVIEIHEDGKSNGGLLDQQEEEKVPLQTYWKHDEKSSKSEAPWPTDDMHHSARHPVLNVRPISALKTPHEIDVVYPPSSPTLISLSHCLGAASSREAVQIRHGQESRESQQSFKFSDQRNSPKNDMEKRGPRTGSCSDSPILVSEDVAPRLYHAQSCSTQIRVVANSPKPSSVRIEESTHRNRSFPDDNREAHLDKSANGVNPLTVSADTESNVPSSQIFDCDSQRGIHSPSRTPHNYTNSAPSRSDLSLAYFLNQPRPEVRRQNHVEEGATSGQSLRGQFTNARGSTSRGDPMHWC